VGSIDNETGSSVERIANEVYAELLADRLDATVRKAIDHLLNGGAIVDDDGGVMKPLLSLFERSDGLPQRMIEVKLRTLVVGHCPGPELWQLRANGPKGKWEAFAQSL
jgi:hypothetical protein